MRTLHIILTLIILLSQQLKGADPPLGWASLNGGTSGGEGGDTIIVSDRGQLLKSLSVKKPAVILIRDTIELLGGEMLSVQASNISIIGSGRNAMIRNGGLMIMGSNIIIRDLSIGDSYQDGHWDGKGDPGTDCLTLYGKNIWVDHCHLFRSFDGLLDITGMSGTAADFITVSWTRFSNHNKVMLVGSNDRQTYARGHFRVTVHHCWFDGLSEFYDAADHEYYRLNQRLPRVRFGDVHVFNNYYEQVESYCIAARLESDVVAEYNYFRNLEDPHIIEDTGMGERDPSLVVRDNFYENVRGRREKSGTAFDPSLYYSYNPDPVREVPSRVMNGAGITDRNHNNQPVAFNDTVRIQGEKTVIRPLENDSDPDGDSLRISRILNEPQGEVILDAGSIVYYRKEARKEAQNDVRKGTDTIIYEIIDYRGGVSTASIVLNIM